MLRKWKLAPTRREQEKWDKATKAATGGSVSYMILLVNFHSTFVSFGRMLLNLWSDLALD